MDTRSAKQKQQAKARQGPQQMDMFTQREVAQFGVRACPLLPIAPKTHMELLIEDHRSEEEKACDVQREAERLTYPLPGIHAAEAFPTSPDLNPETD